jgi:phosphoadenosine phosphosulfate reductase
MISTLKSSTLDLATVNRELQNIEPSNLVKWSADTFGDGLVMTTSFGIQAAVMLDLVTNILPNIPVIWIDTGYLPPETYRFADELTQRLNLNLKVYQSDLSPARMEALYGKLWEQENLVAFDRYDRIRKVEPMQRAIKELNVTAWLAGLRKDQTEHRQGLERVALQEDIYRIYPILSWNARDIYRYLTKRDLPHHPYFDLGYVTVGDWHSSRPLTADDNNKRDTRFRGLKQECGLHLPQTLEEEQSINYSSF